MQTGGRLAWVVSRIILYTAVVVSGFAIAGIIGTTKLHEKSSTCLLNTEVRMLSKDECCTRFVCQTCKRQEDCADTSYPSTCTGGNCQPDQCFASSGATKTSRCKYVITFGAISGSLALIMVFANVYKACNKNAEALKRIYTLKGNKLEYPDFYAKLTAAMYMGWVNMLALTFLGITSITRYYCNRSKASSYSISADGHDDGDANAPAPSHVFSETEDDDAQLLH
ncbi:hypothetical protein PTSG_11744 [Salpingoeca rosetta]|uniref:Uncharacterized protein n=1 Tax=Salpingoeca rosetta (strain ATCC 50818 / BSB-021) TaxID=946362 RepID=F2U0G9_SALR5|nr:uncharacterized protein PTSG_11744 [Salpingoeca rosetta]EGD80897.1 hypothetical protein PTSG_11744 [Salpingoeca rosetta]|eukprot:XP_004997458.1 hypothetical protein PTSG_11744 [Salpingoeca rosetta]